MSRLGQESLLEMYNATMTTLGIPADAPITAEVKVIPTVLESVSRTAGIYIIKSATDTISTDGTYTTQFKLFRIRGLNEADAVSAKEKIYNIYRNCYIIWYRFWRRIFFRWWKRTAAVVAVGGR